MIISRDDWEESLVEFVNEQVALHTARYGSFVNSEENSEEFIILHEQRMNNNEIFLENHIPGDFKRMVKMSRVNHVINEYVEYLLSGKNPHNASDDQLKTVISKYRDKLKRLKSLPLSNIAQLEVMRGERKTKLRANWKPQSKQDQECITQMGKKCPPRDPNKDYLTQEQIDVESELVENYLNPPKFLRSGGSKIASFVDETWDEEKKGRLKIVATFTDPNNLPTTPGPYKLMEGKSLHMTFADPDRTSKKTYEDEKKKEFIEKLKEMDKPKDPCVIIQFPTKGEI